MDDCLVPTDGAPPSIPIHAVSPDGLSVTSAMLARREADWVAAAGFKAAAGAVLLIPADAGGIGAVFFGLGSPDATDRTPLLPGKLPTAVPPGTYRLGEGFADPELATLAWLLGAYRFTRYRADGAPLPRLIVPAGVDGEAVSQIAAGV